MKFLLEQVKDETVGAWKLALGGAGGGRQWPLERCVWLGWRKEVKEGTTWAGAEANSKYVYLF